MINVSYNMDRLSGTAIICYLIVAGIMIAAMWKIFVKAGKPGWAIFIPFYSNYCQFDITFGNGWLFFLLFVPIVNFIVMIMMYFKLAKVFGKGVGFGFGLLFLPFFFLPALGFSDTEYIGPR